MTIDLCVAAIITKLAIWVLLNGADDLFVAMVAGYVWLRARFGDPKENQPPSEEELDAVPQRRMAIFVCLWKEHGVIREMIEHNVRSIRYRNYDFFIGVYPGLNDAMIDFMIEAFDDFFRS